MESFLFPHACVRRAFIEEESAPHPRSRPQESFRLSRRFQCYAALITSYKRIESIYKEFTLEEEKLRNIEKTVLSERNF